MTRTMRLILPLALAGVLATTLAEAQTSRLVCGARDQVVAHLQANNGEQVRGMGLAAQNRILEVFVSEETGSWSIIVTSADGMTCLMAAGHYYVASAPLPPGEPL